VKNGEETLKCDVRIFGKLAERWAVKKLSFYSISLSKRGRASTEGGHPRTFHALKSFGSSKVFQMNAYETPIKFFYHNF